MRWLAAIALRWATPAGIVDQIDNGIAAVELPDLTVVLVPIEALPLGVREGDRVRVRAGRPVDKSTKNAGDARRRRSDVP